MRANLGLGELVDQLKAGRPVILAVQTDDEDPPGAGHFVLALGANAGRVTISDPMTGKRAEVGVDDLVRRWVVTTPDGETERGSAIVFVERAVGVRAAGPAPSFVAR